MATPSPATLLQQASSTGLSSSTSLSPDGKSLTILGNEFDASTPVTLVIGESNKTVTYSLASIYLQLVNTSVIQYRKACESFKVEDPVKVLDKAGIISYFLGGAEGTAGADTATASAAPTQDENLDNDDMELSDDEGEAAATAVEKEEPSASKEHVKEEKRHRSSSRDEGKHHDKDREHRSRSGSDSKHRHHKDKDRKHSHKEKDRHSKSSTKFKDDEEKKKGGGSSAKGVPITNEQLVQNLGLIVDKRENKKQSQTPASPGKNSGEAGKNTTTTPAEGVATPSDQDGKTPVDSRQITPATTPVPEGESAAKQLDEKAIMEQKQQKERQLLLQWLSPEGFEVTSPEVAAAIEKDREATRRITALEIPVGDSASILRAGAGGEVLEKTLGGTGGTPGGGNVNVKRRDFARVLEIYQEVIQAEEKAKRSSSSKGKRPAPPPPPSSKFSKMSRSSSNPASSSAPKPPVGNPIIVVPNAMTSCITMINAGFFFGKDAVYIPRDQAIKRPDAGKRGGTISITRKVSPRLGGGEITYDIIDNPTTRLKSHEWNRIVAVVAQGASWQFKGWKHSDPVELFSRSFGFYIGLEGATVPDELRGWNVRLGKVSRDRRGLDSICLASFWNGLEEFMAVHKQEFFNM